MKKIKILVASVLFCAMSYTGYTAYERVTIPEAEKFMQANVEALTSGEVPGGGNTPGLITCYNGGPGSSQCSIDGGINIVGSGVSAACSVTCRAGYYACCGIRCTCYKE